MDEIAARAGISKGGLYLYFNNKEEVFQAAVGYAAESHRSDAAKKVREGKSAAEKLRSVISVHIEFMEEKRKLFYFMMGGSSGPPHVFQEKIMEERDKFLAIIRGILEEGIRRKEFREMDMEMAAKFFFGALVVVCGDLLFMKEGEEFNAAAVEEKLMDLVLKGFEEGGGSA